MGAFSSSVYLWKTIDPHLLLFVFLPPLLFADCMNIQWHYFKRCFMQCVILAGPGVVVGCGLTAAFVKYCFPYGWGWPLSLTIGAILSATDPVAVVAILKSCGVSPKLTVLIAGESLLNDGAAVVIFNIVNAIMLDQFGDKEALSSIGANEQVTAWNILLYFLRMAVAGPLVGLFCGMLSLFFIHKAARKTSHVDPIVQFAVTLSCAYLSFFVGEEIFGVSGVLACVTAGIVVGVFGAHTFVDPEGMEHIWHAIEWLFNTIIFVLSGVMIGDCVAGLHDWTEIRWAILLYAVPVVLGRYFMMAMFYPLLKRMGYGLEWKSAFVACWGGLRGEVGIALAMVVSNQMTSNGRAEDGSRVLLIACGAAMLTLTINGITSKVVLKKLGMMKTEKGQEKVFESVSRALHEYNLQNLDDYLAELPDADQVATRLKVEKFKSICQSSIRKSMFLCEGAEPNDEDLVVIRELFLRVLKTIYQEQVENGELPHQGREALILAESADVALDSIQQVGLSDLDVVLEYCDANKSMWHKLLDKVATAVGHRQIDDTTACCMLRCFIQAHTKTQGLICEYVGESKDCDVTEQQIINESKEEVNRAQKALDGISKEIREKVAIRQVSQVVLEKSRQHIMEVHEGGLIDDGQAHHLLQELEDDQHRLKA
eukprot:gnl/MRDRNA2_/MRDRNA2_76888_c1_seq2.p1 gnl/MRDRNA2_/MRDRNA2_76888_c1~~gnl/MRDRNA2_/MRDRNA2_76888_c1_seq2.p1  ORF type:complete len:690 (+),score=116.84 gnl/MRDRNA2_/MRDRNA2_76888_c1_seq2:109-2070(+)